MENNRQEKYAGYRLLAVPKSDMEGLKVVDRNGKLGVVTFARVISSSEKDNPNRTVYIQIDWTDLGLFTYYHWQLGWVVVGDKPEMAATPILTPLLPDTTPPKVSTFERLKKSIAKLFNF